MKSRIGVMLFAIVFAISCSSDNDENSNTQNTIIGTWDAVELKVDSDTASEYALIGGQILKFLSNKDCFIITLTFSEDLTAVAKNAIATAISTATLDSGGLQVPCPASNSFETVSNTYTYGSGVVSFLNEDGETIEVPVAIKGDKMTVNAASLQLADFNEGGELVFKRR